MDLLATLDRPGDARHAVLAALTATTPAPDDKPHTFRPATFELLSLTYNAIQRLIAA